MGGCFRGRRGASAVLLGWPAETSRGNPTTTTGSVSEAEPMTDCGKALFFGCRVTGLMFTRVQQQLYDLFQGVPSCVLTVLMLYIFVFVRLSPSDEKVPWLTKSYKQRA